ncbi:cytochrome P450 82A3-like [Mercurialis annua]|uniref:cytochrome P450 82A3-like n=1 Tax=Mercurialis annua TaxID=3986 RepID=UPI002160DEE6|nr:cytochrome P450 82A3-like [Mercurialis annua]
MENFLSLPSNTMTPGTVTVTLLIIICSFLWLTRTLLAKKKKAAPEAGGAWPLLGHLHLLGGPQPPHIVLGDMADKYGPIFSIKMGIHKTLVVSNWETAKECFTTNDRALADRPKLLAGELLAYDHSMFAFSSYGNYWRQMRKIATLELLSNTVSCWLGLTLAASDTTSVTLIWALSLLVNNPHILKKAQQEIYIHIGKEMHVRESDLNNLIYLKAIVKETLRLYPAGPLSVPHESMEDCTIAGYCIPRGTRLLTNIWKIHRDPNIWSDPSEYRPERFLTSHKDFDVRGQNFEFLPFGSGRRMCPGISFALQILHLTLATLLHGFDFSVPTSEPTNMTEALGLTNLKATPLEVLINPRLQSHLYQ